MIINVNYLLLSLHIAFVVSFEIDDVPTGTTEGAFIFTNGQAGRFRSANQTDDIVSTIYSTVASVTKDLENKFTNTPEFPLKEDELKECRGESSDEKFTVRPNHRVCDYLVSRSHSGICSLDLTLLEWNGECRDSWLEVAGKLECGVLTGTRRVNFDRSSISIRMRSSEGILVVNQIPCSNQITPPTIFDNLTVPLRLKPEDPSFPEPYIPPNLRPTTLPSNQDQIPPIDTYLTTSQLNPQSFILMNSIDNNIPSRIDSVVKIQPPNTKYPSEISHQNHKSESFALNYRPQSMYPGMRYGPPNCEKSSGVVISSIGYPNTSPPNLCSLILYPNSRVCAPFIYFDYFEVGEPFGSSCQGSRLEIGGYPFCGCLTGMSWQVPSYIFSSDGSLGLCFKGQGRFLITIYFNTCQSGFNLYPPSQRQPWRCQQPPQPQPIPVNPYPIQPPRPYPVQPPVPRPIPPPPRPLPPRPTYPKPQPYPYPPKMPPPQPPFPYPPRPQPQPPRPYPTPAPFPAPFPAPQPFPEPRPIPVPQPQPPQPIPQPYPPCQVVGIPQGSFTCAPTQPQSYCYRFELPQGYCQMAIKLEDVSMTSNSDCSNEYITTGVRNPRICGENMENAPLYLDNGESFYTKLMPGSSFKARFQGMPCSCDVEYKQTDFTLRATPTLDTCHYTFHRANQGICSLEMTLENVDLQCGVESLLIDEKSYCGQRANEKLEVPFVDPKFIVHYQRNGNPYKPGSFSIRISQRSSCVHPLPSSFARAGGRKYESCVLRQKDDTGVIEFTESNYYSYQNNACTYLFPSKPGYCYVKIDFDDVDIPSTPDCTDHYIFIDGIRYCNKKLTSATKVLFCQNQDCMFSYNVDRRAKWRFTYYFLPCRLETSSLFQS